MKRNLNTERGGDNRNWFVWEGKEGSRGRERLLGSARRKKRANSVGRGYTGKIKCLPIGPPWSPTCYLKLYAEGNLMGC